MLEHAYVVPVKVRESQVEHAIAEREARVDQRRPCCSADNAVLSEPMLPLEGADGFCGQPKEDAIDPRRPKIVAEGEKASLYVFDGRAPGAGAHGSHSRRFPLRIASRLRSSRNAASAS